MDRKIIPLLMACVTLVFCFEASANNLLSYSRISKKESKTDVNINTLETHFQWFKDHNIHVKSLDDSMTEVSANNSSNTVSLVFEGGFDTFVTNVEPLLKKYNYSALLLVNPFNIEAPDYISGDDLNKLASEQNLTIGIVPNHKFFSKYTTKSSIQKNLKEYRDKLNGLLIHQNKGNMYVSISTPFDGMDSVFDSVKIIPIGKVQGVLSKYNTFLNRRFISRGNIALSKLKVNSTIKPLPMIDVLPSNSYLTQTTNNPPAYGFTITNGLSAKSSKVSCFTPDSIQITKHNMEGGRVELRFSRKIALHHTVNVYCSLKNSGNVYSYARTFYVGK